MSVSFGKYQLLERIKTGGMAEIWLARQEGIEDFERLVVIKKVLPGLSEDKDFIEMFLDEGRLAAQLNHPNIVQIYELGQFEDCYYIAMEYIPGVNLQELMKTMSRYQSAPPIPLMCQIIAQVAKGLHFAHTSTDMYGTQLNIVHRDISPQNILVSYDGSVKIVDFGIAKAESQSNKTKTGMLKGKFSYMSPEQISGIGLDQRSDIFALGTVLYELTMGRRLFKGESEVHIVRMIADQPVKPPYEIDITFPRELSRIIMKALEKDPNERYKTAHDFQVDLEHFLAHQKQGPPTLKLGQWLQTLFNEKITALKLHRQELLQAEQVRVKQVKRKKFKKPLLILLPLLLITIALVAIALNPQNNQKKIVKKPEKKATALNIKAEKPPTLCDHRHHRFNDRCFTNYHIKTIGGNSKEIASAIAIDSKGNRYIAGYFHGTLSFNNDTITHTSKTPNKSDIFITKIDQNDRYRWTKVIGGDWNDHPEAIAIDHNDNIYLTGSYSGTVDFNFGKGEDIHRSKGSFDIFLTKINADGSYGWSKTFGEKSYLDRGTALTFDDQNNVYFGGWFSGSGIEVYHHKNLAAHISSQGSGDLFIIKLDQTGKYLWHHTAGSTGWDGITGLTYKDNILYTTGFFSGDIKFSPKLTAKSKGGEDIFIAQLNPKNGIPKSLKTFGTLGNDRSQALLVHNKTCYISGYLGGDFITPSKKVLKNSGSSDIFVAAFGIDNSYKWLKTIGSRGEDATIDMALNKEQLYLTGWFQYAVDFDPSEKTDLKPGYGSRDIFISQFDLDGNYKKTWIIGGQQQDKSRGIVFDNQNNLHLVGWFKDTVDFDLSPKNDNHTSRGLEDAFILKWHIE